MVKMDAASLIKLNRKLKSNRLKFFGVYVCDLLDIRHLILRFDPIQACNLRCQMCYYSDPVQREHLKGRFSREEIEKIAREFFPRALQLYIGCSSEPTMYKGFTDIVRIAKEHKVPFVSFTSNGQLINETHLREFLDHGLDEITLSVHGVQTETYETLMPGASHDRFLRLLRAIDGIKKHRGTAFPKIRLNYTANPDNLSELRDFFDVYGDVDISTIQIRPIIDLGDVQYKRKDLTPFFDLYDKALDVLDAECRNRNIRLMCNRLNPTYSEENIYAPVYAEGVARFIRPGMVWEPDFDVMKDTYRAYSRRSGFRKKMLDYATGLRRIPIGKTPLASSEVV